MIGFLRGKILSKGPEGIVLDVSGVGYEVSVPLGTLTELPKEGGEEVLLSIHTHVRDDSIQLFGFFRPEEKRVFRTLLGVTGIGPKMALNILSGIPCEDLLSAIETEDVGLLTRVPGLGKKTAHRLILELREKLPERGEGKDRVFDDAVSALVNLGYRKTDSAEAVDKAYKKGLKTIEELLRESLKTLTGARV